MAVPSQLLVPAKSSLDDARSRQPERPAERDSVESVL